MVYLNDQLYVFGGFYEQKNGSVKYLNDFYAYNIIEDKWIHDNRKINKPSPRSGFTMWTWEGIL
jgi:N-acetylneuraminic acid mutarotase